MLAQSCTGCHGERGASNTAPMPSIGGQNEAFLITAMKAYRDGKRPGTVMPQIAKGFTDAQIGDIAAHLSKQPWKAGVQSIDPALAAKGKPIFSKACADCHPNGGRESKESDYPLLAGQWLSFLHLSANAAINGNWKVDNKFLAKIEGLKADELEAVLAFLAAQQ